MKITSIVSGALISVALFSNAHALTPAFKDVSPDAWYAPYVQALNQAHIVDSALEFRPADSLNRAELVKMIITAIDGLQGLTLPPNPTFDDVRPGEWYTNYIEAAATLGIVMGYADARGNLIGLFGPADTVTRAEAAKMLVGAFDLQLQQEGAKSYPDVRFGDWFYEYTLIASQHNVVAGYDDGRFGPADPVTRAQIAKMLAKAMQSAGLMEALEPEPMPEDEADEPAAETPTEDEGESETDPADETESLPPAEPNPLSVSPVNTPAGSPEVFVSKYTFRANLEDFRVETVTVVNDIVGDKLGDELAGTATIKNVVLKFPDRNGKLVSESRPLGSDGKARFTGLTFFAPRDQEAFFEIYAELTAFSEVGEALSGQVFRLGLQDINHDDSTFRAVGDTSGTVIGFGGSRLRVISSQVNPFTVRKSVPSFTLNPASTTLTNGETSLYSFTVEASSAGSIGLARLTFDLSVSDANGAGLNLSDFKLYRGSSSVQNVFIYDGTGALSLMPGSGNSLSDGLSSVIVTFDQEESVSAGSALTYSLRATISGSEPNDSISTGFSTGDEETALMGLTAKNQPNTGKVFVTGDAAAGIFTTATDFRQTPGNARDIIWSDKSAGFHLFPTISGGTITSDTGSADWTNGYLLKLSGLEDHTISR